MKQPVLFFAFANQAEEPLPDLLEEGKLIDEAFSNHQSGGEFDLHLDKHASTEDIIRKLRDFRNRISVFHFGGHAGSSHLYLTDLSANSQGLSRLLGLQKHLKLVFLNGCNTSGFIQQLLDQGIPAVIATTREVDDALALKLAELFYKSLSKGSTIGEAFDFAKAAVTLDDSVTQEISRGLKLPESPENDFPWGLYYKNEEACEWKLENAQADVNPLPEYFWLRLGMIVLPIALLYIWSLIHFGFDNLTIYLTILGALSGLVFFLIKFYGNKFPGIQNRVSGFQSFSLKPAVIGTLCFLVIGIIATITSVRIQHPGVTSLSAHLKDQKGLPVSYFNIHQGNQDLTTLLAFINPFVRDHRLEIEGYEPLNVHYGIISGAKILPKMLVTNPSVLVRLPHQKLILKKRLRLKVFLNGELYHYLPDGLPPSLLLGNQKNKIEENIYSDWSEALKFEEPVIRDEAIKLWLNPLLNDTLKPLHLGDIVKIELYNKLDDLLTVKEITITKKNITDVLLN